MRRRSGKAILLGLYVAARAYLADHETSATASYRIIR